MSYIRFAERKDKEKLVEFICTMISNPEEVAVSIVEEFFVNKQYIVFVIDEQFDIKGFGVLKLDPFEGANGVAEIVFLGIQKPYRRKGLARMTVEHIQEYVKGMGIRKLYTKPNPDNKPAVCFWIMQNYKFEARLLDFSSKGHDSYLVGKVL